MTASIFTSVEFYVICAVVAAAVVAFSARPASRGPAAQHLLAGTLLEAAPGSEPARPSIELTVNPDLSVTLVRHGLAEVDMSGAVSLAVEVKGFDIDIRERATHGRGHGHEAAAALFTLDFLAPERYHLRYTADGAQETATGALNVRPGIHILRPLT